MNPKPHDGTTEDMQRELDQWRRLQSTQDAIERIERCGLKTNAERIHALDGVVKRALRMLEDAEQVFYSQAVDNNTAVRLMLAIRYVQDIIRREIP